MSSLASKYFMVTAMDLWPARLAKIRTPMPLFASEVKKDLLPEWLLAPEMPAAR
jgi:hypothetical protein